ncbi:MAG: 16S rRNA (uracil(1498)-N(3))-methyltransferase [Clostridia bacterium]|nr:16S rRNA (uracil(1498)-N(3))-methyltransferase [Clostridia bacterium]
MSRKYFINEIPEGNQITISGQEFNHIINVMRTKLGESITFMNGKGYNCQATLDKIEKDKAIFNVDTVSFENTSDFELLVCVGLMKGDKNEFVIQKCAELGATKIIFFESEFCIAKSKDNKLERYNKISIEASKQCGRSTFLDILPTVKFKNLCEMLKDYDRVFCAYEKSSTKINISQIVNNNKLAIVIGSEGGFSEKEINLIKENSNTEIITLGSRILRAETAVLALTTIVMHEKGEI